MLYQLSYLTNTFRPRGSRAEEHQNNTNLLGGKSGGPPLLARDSRSDTILYRGPFPGRGISGYAAPAERRAERSRSVQSPLRRDDLLRLQSPRRTNRSVHSPLS